MVSVNKVIFIGNVGKDFEVCYNFSGGVWCMFSLVMICNWKNCEIGEC